MNRIISEELIGQIIRVCGIEEGSVFWNDLHNAPTLQPPSGQVGEAISALKRIEEASRSPDPQDWSDALDDVREAIAKLESLRQPVETVGEDCKEAFKDWWNREGWKGVGLSSEAFPAWEAAWALRTQPQAPVPSGRCVRPAQCAKGWGGNCYGSTPCDDRQPQAPVKTWKMDYVKGFVPLPRADYIHAPQAPVVEVPAVEELWSTFSKAVEVGKADVLTLHRLEVGTDFSAHLSCLGVKAIHALLQSKGGR